MVYLQASIFFLSIVQSARIPASDTSFKPQPNGRLSVLSHLHTLSTRLSHKYHRKMNSSAVMIQGLGVWGFGAIKAERERERERENLGFRVFRALSRKPNRLRIWGPSGNPRRLYTCLSLHRRAWARLESVAVGLWVPYRHKGFEGRSHVYP